MKIGILGWGSLLWDKRDDFDGHHGAWRQGGPKLTLEFSRVSRKTRRGALTLVIDPTFGSISAVAFTASKRTVLSEAIRDLKERERTIEANIGYWRADTGESRCRDDETLQTIRSWAKAKKLSAVVWTDLRSNFEEETGGAFSIQAALAHFKGLPAEGRSMMAEYVLRAPQFVETPLRAALRAEPAFAAQLAGDSVENNVLEMGLIFTAMMRLFMPGSNRRILGMLRTVTARLAEVDNIASFEAAHGAFCEWFCGEISTCEKSRGGRCVKKSQSASYGQAAKVFDIVLKVYVHYCSRPSASQAARLRSFLHAAVDTQILSYLKSRFPEAKVTASTIEQLDARTYSELQGLIRRDLLASYSGHISAVEYDDIIWRQLNRGTFA
jgi:hypothetical protein